MGWIILILLGIVLAIYPQVIGYRFNIAPLITRVIGMLIALAGLMSTSYTVIDADAVGHLKRIYTGSAMPPGRIIAFRGENGPQAEVLPPGLNLRPLLNVLYEVEAVRRSSRCRSGTTVSSPRATACRWARASSWRAAGPKA